MTEPIDKRAAVLRFIEEQEAICEKADPGPWNYSLGTMGGPTIGAPNGHWICDLRTDGIRVDYSKPGTYTLDSCGPGCAANTRFVIASRYVLPLALAALKAEVEKHTLGQGSCFMCASYLACPTIDTFYSSLSLQQR